MQFEKGSSNMRENVRIVYTIGGVECLKTSSMYILAMKSRVSEKFWGFYRLLEVSRLHSVQSSDSIGGASSVEI